MYGMHFYFHVWFIYTTNLFSRIVLHELFICARDCLRFLSFGHTILHNSLIVTFEFPRTIHFTRAIFTQFTCDFSNDIFFTRNFYTDGLSLVFFFFINVSSFPPVIHIFSHIIFTQNNFTRFVYFHMFTFPVIHLFFKIIHTIPLLSPVGRTVLFSHVIFPHDSFFFQTFFQTRSHRSHDTTRLPEVTCDSRLVVKRPFTFFSHVITCIHVCM